MLASSKEELGSLLVEEGFITARQLDKAMEKAESSGDNLQKVLISMGFVTEKDVVETLGAKMGVDFVDLDNMNLDPELARPD